MNLLKVHRLVFPNEVKLKALTCTVQILRPTGTVKKETDLKQFFFSLLLFK